MSRKAEREAILLRVHSSREAMGNSLHKLGQATNVNHRIHKSVRQYPVAWIAGSITVGVILSSLFRRGPSRSPAHTGGVIERDPSRSLIVGTLTLLGNQLLAMSLPSLKEWATNEFSQWLKSRPPSSPPDDHPAP